MNIDDINKIYNGNNVNFEMDPYTVQQCKKLSKTHSHERIAEMIGCCVQYVDRVLQESSERKKWKNKQDGLTFIKE